MTTVDVACECRDCVCSHRVPVDTERLHDDEPVLCQACENHDIGGEG